MPFRAALRPARFLMCLRIEARYWHFQILVPKTGALTTSTFAVTPFPIHPLQEGMWEMVIPIDSIISFGLHHSIRLRRRRRELRDLPGASCVTPTGWPRMRSARVLLLARMDQTNESRAMTIPTVLSFSTTWIPVIRLPVATIKIHRSVEMMMMAPAIQRLPDPSMVVLNSRMADPLHLRTASGTVSSSTQTATLPLVLGTRTTHRRFLNFDQIFPK